MNNPHDCQQSSNDDWTVFAAEIAKLSRPEPSSGALRVVLDELDGIVVETAAADPLAEFEAELDRIIAASERAPTPVIPTPMPARPKTFLDHWKKGLKIASNTASANLLQTPAIRALEYARAQGCLVRRPTPPSTPPISHSKGTTKGPTTGKPWERATAADKFDHAMHTAQAHDGLALTLNLSPAREKAIARSADPARAMSRHLQRSFKDLGLAAPGLAFILEISPADRVHVHGAVIPGDLGLDLLKRALMRAGGKLAGRSACRQVKLKPIDNAGGWSGYLRKDAGRTRRALGLDKITFISADLRALTRDDWRMTLH